MSASGFLVRVGMRRESLYPESSNLLLGTFFVKLRENEKGIGRKGAGMRQYESYWYAFLFFFSCASAKAECSLSSLYGVFLYVELGDPPHPPGQDFMGPDQNARPLLYDSKFAHECKILWVQTVMLHLN